jgi:hypothetical protein
VQPGDTPASIAATFAGCPKCQRDLLAVNPGKARLRYANGYETFQDLRPGETLSLPDKWFDGTLDRLPRSYFEALPSSPHVAPSSPRSWGLSSPGSRLTIGGRVARGFGLGDATSAIPIPSTSAAVSAAFGNLSAEQQTIVLSANQAAQGAQGAVSLAQSVASGGVPTEAAIVTGLASVGSMFGGPVAGAAMAAAGGLVIGFSSALQALFSELGWYDTAWTTYNYNGLLRTGLDPIPYGPGDESATWFNVDGSTSPCGLTLPGATLDPIARYLNLRNFAFTGEAATWSSPPFLCIGAQSPSQNVPGMSASTLSYASTVAIAALLAMQQNMDPVTQDAILGASWNGGGCNVWGASSPGVYGPYTLKAAGLPASSYVTSNGFELFFNTLFIKNSTLAANGLAFIPPRQLLLGAAYAWNAVTPGDCGPGATCGALKQSICYQPRDSTSGLWYEAAGGTVPLASIILGGVSDPSGQDAAPLCVNAGAGMASGGASPAPAASSPASTVAKGAAVALGAGAVGFGAYAFITKQTLSEAAKRLWKKAKT